MQILSTLQSNWLFCIAGFISLVPLLTYPLHNTFPVSHEAPQYIMESLSLKAAFSQSFLTGLHALSTGSWYPGTTLTLFFIDLLTPLSWPTLMIWLTVIMHFAIGLALSRIAQQCHGKIAAALTLLIWSATFTAMRPILNGWMAHWWSLLPTVITLERILQQKYTQAFWWLLVTALIHPLSALVVLLTGLLTLPSYLVQEPRQQKRHLIIILTLGLITAATWWLIDKAYIFDSLKSAKPLYSLRHLLTSPISPAVIAAPLGLAWFIHNRPKKISNIFLLLFWFTSVMLTFNHLWLPGGLLEWRFEPYLLLSISLVGGMGIATTLRTAINQVYAHHALTLSLFICLTVSGWHHNLQYFANYNGANLLIPLTEELQAIDWLRTLPPNTHLVSTRHDLNYKWLPILTHHSWTGIREGETIYLELTQKEKQQEMITAKKLTHLVIFKNREDNIDSLISPFSHFPTVLENDAVLIKSLSLAS